MLIKRSLVQPTSRNTPRGGRKTAAMNLGQGGGGQEEGACVWVGDRGGVEARSGQGGKLSPDSRKAYS